VNMSEAPLAGSAVVEMALYAADKKVYPRAVSGWFAAWRWGLVWATQLVFYGGAWLAWNDRQAILFDIVHRKFYIFGLVFWPQDIIYLTVLLIIAALSLFLFTAVAGRLWCGYACPQTVYTEIFLWVERVIEGDRNRRILLDRGRWDARKLGLKAAKHTVWIAIALWTGFTFVGYVTPIRAVGRGDDALPVDRRGPQPRLGPVGSLLDPVLRFRHLRQRRLDARAGVHLHVPVRALPERDVRQGHAGHHL